MNQLEYSTTLHAQTASLSTGIQYRNNFISGGAALSFAYAVMHPLDTFKIRLQAVLTHSSRVSLRYLLSRDTARLLTRGFFASISGAAPQGALRFSTYELTKARLYRSSSSEHSAFPFSPVAISAISAVSADFASSLAKLPREVITTRMQTTRSTSTFSIVSQILQTAGPLGFFRGFVSTSLRDVPFMVILFTTYEQFKAAHQGEGISNGIPQTMASTLFGGVSGGLAGFFTTPLDVIKTRVMCREQGGMREVMKEIWQESDRRVGRAGRVLFLGSGARSVWWFGICALCFPGYEKMKRVMECM